MTDALQRPSVPQVAYDDPEEPAYADDGTDLTLIRSMLLKTPTERLQALQEQATTVLRIWRELGYR